jgi:hypothetical protein
MLSAAILSIGMLSAGMLSVVAPFCPGDNVCNKIDRNSISSHLRNLVNAFSTEEDGPFIK